MQDDDAVVPLTDGDEAVCAFFIERLCALRRVVQLMPHGDFQADFVQKLWSYAVLRNRKVDLANALLGYSKSAEYPQLTLGRDWYRGCNLPSRCPEFFYVVRRYAWTKAAVEAGEYDVEDIDAIEADIATLEDIKESIGDGIVGMEKVVTQIKLRRNAIIKAERKIEKELMARHGRRKSDA